MGEQWMYSFLSMKCILFVGITVSVKTSGDVTFVHEKVTGLNPKWENLWQNIY